jgi:hypothetical protein
MDPETGDIADRATCTTCQFTEDLSNYWTAVLFFKARNGSYHRVPQIPNVGFEGQTGGMTVYYMQDGLANYEQTSKVTAFKTGFRMLIGEAAYREREQANRFRQITYTCLKDMGTRFPESLNFPEEPCPAGIMANVRFPTCWDGVNLDTPDHMAHMSYPELGTFESGGPCPASHPVRVPQLMYETIWDTAQFNDPEQWPEDGSQPFVWSMDDRYVSDAGKEREGETDTRQHRFRLPRRLHVWVEGRLASEGHGHAMLRQLPDAQNAEHLGDEQVLRPDSCGREI